ncbi:MAG: clostripain-related cysteine peptidase [Candidatus Heimdallarchaeota archaeon]
MKNDQVVIADDNLLTSNTDSYPKAETLDWLLMFYIDGDIDHEFGAFDAINELELGYSLTDSIEVIILLDLIEGNDISDGDYGGARYYRLLPGDDPMIIESEILEEMYEVNMGSGNTLRSFVSWTMARYTAENTALFIFNHGGGLSGICWDWTSDHDHLTLQEIQVAMTGYHVDILLTEACGMSYLEVAYEFRTFTDYFASSQQSMKVESIDYEAAIAELCANPTINPWELGGIFGRTYLEFYDYTRSETYSVINCTNLTPVLSGLSNLSAELLPLLPSQIDALASIRNKLGTTTNFRYVDLGTMINELQVEYYSQPTIANTLLDLEIAYNDSVVYNFNAKYTRDNTGLNIFFPFDNTTYSLGPWADYINSSLPGELGELDFLSDSTWSVFLVEYIKYAPYFYYHPPPITNCYVDTNYLVEFTGDQYAKLFMFHVTTPGIYNMTAEVLTGDILLSQLNIDDMLVVETSFFYSDLANPEQSSIEHTSIWFNAGDCYLIVSPRVENSSCIFNITRSSPIVMTLNEEITGNFPYSFGSYPPQTIHHYRSIDLPIGSYQVTVNTSWPVGLEVAIIDGDNNFLINSLKGMPGGNFSYELVVSEEQRYIIGVGSYTGTGSFLLTITEMLPDRIPIAIMIIPLALGLMVIITRRRKFRG